MNQSSNDIMMTSLVTEGRVFLSRRHSFVLLGSLNEHTPLLGKHLFVLLAHITVHDFALALLGTLSVMFMDVSV
jgi:hypothetical protein